MRWQPLIGGMVAVAFAVAASAQTMVYQPFTQQGGGAQVPPVVILCATGSGRDALPCGSLAAPLNVMSAPFTRLHSKPIQLADIGTTPKTFPISRPETATTYRIVNPCDVDIRVLGTMSLTDVVAADTGVLYLARTESTMGTSRPNFISAMTIGVPGTTCTPEMHYGIGGG